MEKEVAYINLKATEDGGRQEKILTGYRPNFLLDGIQSDCQITLLNDKTELNPGESGLVTIELIRPQAFGHLLDGEQFFLREGEKIIATGTILT